MTRNAKKPVTRGVARVPFVMQLEALECGAACLTMILAYYGKWIPLEQVRSDCGVSRDGSNAKSILLAARFYGLHATGYRYEPESLRASGAFPCIIHWEFNHFVVLCGFRGGRAYLNDPARGSYSVSMEDFDASFTGVCLQMEPGEGFLPAGHQKSVLSFASKRLKGTGSAVAFSVLVSIIMSLIAAINPAFSRVFLDRLLSGSNPEWVVPFLILLGVFTLLQIVMSAMQAIYKLRINGKIAAVGSAAYMWKIFRLPMEFFSQRMAGDIANRQASNATIAATLIDTLAPLALNSIMMVLYFVIMVRYSLLLTLVGLSSLFISAIVSDLIAHKRVNIARVALRDQGHLLSSTVSGIEMIETIKSAGAEQSFFAKWSGYQASANAQEVRYTKLDQYLGLIPQFVTGLANNAVLILGVYLVMQGEFTPGMILAFQSFLTLFMAPALTFVSAGQLLTEMRAEMERVEDVMEYPTDRILGENLDRGGSQKLTGHVELRHVSFGYSKLAEPLIRDFDLDLQPGSSVAIVGATGCGKSTISKLVSGLYRPWSGELLLDGKPLNEIDRDIFHGSLAVVDQDVILFEDTIANNIKMWDDSIEDFEMILAARDAQLHETIMQRPMGYRHKLIEGGKDLSGGQRQKLEIARVLAQDPTVIILDEATSALDAKTEYDVVKAIRDRGITCIVIAHRLSTIRHCDEIIVMSAGRIVARGTHSELLQSSPLYRELVTAE